MQPPRSFHILLALAFFGFLVAVPVYDASHGVYGDFLRIERDREPGKGRGTIGERFSNFVEKKSRVLLDTRGPWNAMTLSLFHHTPGFVVPGRGNWLFAEWSLLDLDPAGTAREERRLVELLQAGRRLAEIGGARYICLVMPSKWRIAPEFLPRMRLTPARRRLYEDILRLLRDLDIETLDVEDLLLEAANRHPEPWLFPPADTHLSRRGVAEVLQAGLLPLLGIDETLVRKRLQAIPSDTITEFGNLAKLLGLDPEGPVGRRYLHTEPAFPTPPPFSAPGADILILGNSYTWYHDRLFPRLIQALTGRTVDDRYAGGRLGQGGLPRLVSELRSSPPHLILSLLDEHIFAAPRRL